ncbi:hypothetical protein Veis_2834 [Verminephrobacter eiseniae EF01-2]|uniref:Transposase n=1 Tax=Verminephrobacter eiseniae (strain EF01-2) TaxID=391735 RepID=A1WLR5_VEREI|nr:hypothetical protein Veis_2834 [Verminephrobacter eiseniae EF01-2]
MSFNLPDGRALFDHLNHTFSARATGMVERFDGRIADVLRPHRCNSREDMEQTLPRHVALYNQLAQSALGSKTPMQAMKEWHQGAPASVSQAAI